MTSCPVLVKRPSGCNVIYVPSKQTANDRESTKMGVYSESPKHLYQRFSIAISTLSNSNIFINTSLVLATYIIVDTNFQVCMIKNINRSKFTIGNVSLCR